MPRSRSTRRPRSDDDQALGVLALLVLAGGSQLVAGTSLRTLVILGVAGASVLLLGTVWLLRRRARQEERRLLLADAASLSPTDFERRVGLLLADLGWTDVRHVGGSGDGGVDLRGSAAGQRFIVQCKRYAGVVHPTHVRDLAGALQHEPADRALLVTTGRVSEQTRVWAADKPITIWDGAQLAAQAQHAAEHRRDPARAQQAQRRDRAALAGLVALNLVTAAVAFVWLPDTPLAARAPAAAAPPAQATVVPIAVPTHAPLPTATLPPPTPVPAPATGTVANGGNVRAAPSLQGAVLDQVHASEIVPLHARSADGAWYHITTARGVDGWTHQSLLTVDAALAVQVPVAAP